MFLSLLTDNQDVFYNLHPTGPGHGPGHGPARQQDS